MRNRREQTAGAGLHLRLVHCAASPTRGVSFVCDREDRFFSTVFLGSGLLFLAMLFAAAGAATALALRADIIGSAATASADTLGFTQALTYAFLYVYAARAAGVFMIVTSTIAWRASFVPKWVAVVGWAISLVLLLSIREFQLIIMLFPAWVALVSLFILFTSGYEST